MLNCGNTRNGWRGTLRHAWPAMLASQAGLLAVLGVFLVLMACVGNVWRLRCTASSVLRMA